MATVVIGQWLKARNLELLSGLPHESQGLDHLWLLSQVHWQGAGRGGEDGAFGTEMSAPHGMKMSQAAA